MAGQRAGGGRGAGGRARGRESGRAEELMEARMKDHFNPWDLEPRPFEEVNRERMSENLSYMHFVFP